MTTARHELCEKIFFGVMEFLVFVAVSVLMAWLMQSRLAVIEQLTPPEVIAVTEDYVDVRWHNRRLLDCPTEGTPIFFTPLATEQLPSRPVAADLQEQTFIRRYFFPEHLLKLHQAVARNSDVTHLAELRIQIIADCNPLWPTQQTIRVPFRMPRLGQEGP